MKGRASRRVHEIHVYNSDGSTWVVASGRRVLSRHWTQHTAVTRGARAAHRRRVDLVVHGSDGRFRSKDSYGNESPRHDTEQ